MKSHYLKTALVRGLVAGSLLASASVYAELTANVAATSDYVWRGTTQTTSGAAIQGGIDWSHKDGVYVGGWTSNTSFGAPESAELDIYGGYSGKAGDIEYDVGVINYRYPNNDGPDLDWVEFYGGVSFGSFSVKASITNDVFGSDTDALYLEAGYDVDLGKGLTLGLHVGNYDFDNNTAAGFDDYTDYSASLSKGEFTFTVSDTDLNSTFPNDDDVKFYITWAKDFNL